MSLEAKNDVPYISGDDEMSAAIRDFDWGSTALGHFREWPQALKTAVRIILPSQYPMFIWWGPQLINIYNEAYIPILGKRHPDALGKPAQKIWSDVWNTVGPQARDVMDCGLSSWSEEILLLMERNGYAEETYFTFSYSPIMDDEGKIGGLFCACNEDTQRVLSQRTLLTLHNLAEQATAKTNTDAVCKAAMQSLEGNSADIPFALLYKLEEGSTNAQLVATTNIDAGSDVAPFSIGLDDDDAFWPLAGVGNGLYKIDLENNEAHSNLSFPTGCWEKSLELAIVLPLTKSTQSNPVGFFVAGINPFRRLDASYRRFFNLIVSHISTAIANVTAYEEEQKRASALADLNQAKTQFFTNVSHEFRTPLTLLLGPLEEMLANPGSLSEKKETDLRLVHRNAMRLLRLVNSLLDFSRMEAGRIQASYEPVDVAAFTAELASNFSSVCESGSLKLTVDTTTISQTVYLDKEMWEKIVFNLISNAFKYTLRGGIHVQVKPVVDAIQFSVTDSGFGIPADELPKLFQRFHRIKNARGRNYEGTGIGLALVKELVNLHGGTIEVESEVNKGSCFKVIIPYGKAHLDQKCVSDKPISDESLSTQLTTEAQLWKFEDSSKGYEGSDPGLDEEKTIGQSERARILWADDNADMRHYVTRILEQHYDVTAVANGKDALKAARSSRPDVILSDVMMPQLDGFGLLNEVRADTTLRDIPVILLSARAGEEARVDGIAGGATDYLVKPFGARELLARIETNVRIVKLQREKERKLIAREEIFREMANNAPTILWLTLPGGECTFLSDGWYQFTGQTPEQALGFGWLDAVHPDDHAMASQKFITADERQESFSIDYRLRSHDGEYRWAVDTARPRFSDDGIFLGYIGTVVDVHVRHIAEEALIKADQRKDEFLATLAHELRNPLAPLRTGLELIKLRKDDPQQVQTVCETMERQIQQLIALVNDLMDVSRITHGRLQLKKCILDISGVVRTAIEATKQQFEEAGHTLYQQMPIRPIFVDADPNRLAQVLSNLLNNAAKYTPDHGVIEIAVTERDQKVVIKIKDNGIGIPNEMKVPIFEMFNQVQHPIDKDYSGLGIGLTLVKSLLEMHGGEITVQSSGENQGSEFIVELPLAHINQLPTEKIENVGSRKNISRRVLVVDNNRDAADSLTSLINMLGYITRTAYDGQEAVTLASEFKPEIILMDLGMPRMDGYEAAEKIRAMQWSGKTLIFALTGWGQKDVKERTKAIGFNDHLVKPIDPKMLRKILTSLDTAETVSSI